MMFGWGMCAGHHRSPPQPQLRTRPWLPRHLRNPLLRRLGCRQWRIISGSWRKRLVGHTGAKNGKHLLLFIAKGPGKDNLVVVGFVLNLKMMLNQCIRLACYPHSPNASCFEVLQEFRLDLSFYGLRLVLQLFLEFLHQSNIS